MTLAWTLLAGVNTRPEDARQLAELTAGLPVRLDLIDVNDATGEFLPPSDAERKAFRDALTRGAGHAGGATLQRRPGHSRRLRHAGGDKVTR